MKNRKTLFLPNLIQEFVLLLKFNICVIKIQFHGMNAAVGLLGEEIVAILIETQTFESAPFVSDLAQAANVLIMSLSITSPAFSSQTFPYFVRMAHSDRIELWLIITVGETLHFFTRMMIFLRGLSPL